MIAPAIEAHGLTKHFGETAAVENLSLQVPKGTIFGLVGPDGAGKTTTIKLLSTILAPTSGSGSITGFDLVSEKRSIRERVGYMSEEFNLYQDLTVRENLVFFADIFGLTEEQKETRLEELLAFSHLRPFLDRRAMYLSGGMKQKLALACILIHEPKILFLDEPTRGVDPVSRREFWRILTDINHRGVTILVSTPYMDEAERCHRVAFLYKGNVLSVESPAVLKKQLKGGLYRIRTKNVHETRDKLKQLEIVEDVEIFGDSVKILLRNRKDRPKLEKALSEKEKSEITETQVDLEAVFIFLLKQLRKEEA